MNFIGRQPSIYNKTLTLADTEYSQELRPGTVKLLVQCRGSSNIKMSFVSGESGTVYLTIKAGSVYYEDMIEGGIRTLFFQSPDAGAIAEIIAWET